MIICPISLFFFSSRRRHTRLQGDWSSDVCSSDLAASTTSPAPRSPVRTPSRSRGSRIRWTPACAATASCGSAATRPSGRCGWRRGRYRWPRTSALEIEATQAPSSRRGENDSARLPLKSTLDRLYRIGLWIKGIDGVLEMAGGLFLLVVSQPQLGQLVTFLTQRRSEEHTSELQSPCNLVCRLLLEK